MADKQATLILKLGDKEVRYEAEREAVEAQLEHIVDRLLQDAPANVQVGLADAGQAAKALKEPPPRAAPETVPEEQLLKQLYTVSDDGRLTLRKLPGRTADTLLLVLYGMRKLQDRSWVHAPGMTSAARASGASFDRADRLLAGYQDLIEGFGKRRAKRYRLTAAGREHCARLVRELVDPVVASTAARNVDVQAKSVVDPPAQNAEADGSGDEAAIPKKVTSRWDGELLTVAETARRLGIEEAEVRKLRFRWELLGLPGGTRKRRRFFCPAFQIDAERGEIYPQVREVNLLVSRRHTSWGIAKWWSTVEPQLGRKPIELIGTPEADAVVRAAKATFVRR